MNARLARFTVMGYNNALHDARLGKIDVATLEDVLSPNEYCAAFAQGYEAGVTDYARQTDAR